MTTRNADMPAMPMVLVAEKHVWCEGLTKREIFAMAAMQGFCSDSNMNLEGIPKAAVDMADALLAELDKAGGE